MKYTFEQVPEILVLIPYVYTMLETMGPDKEVLSVKLYFFHSHQFKHMFWVRKRTVSMRQFF